MVIVKNTMTYQGIMVGHKEYSDLEIMQMLGRAGRPQFDDSAVAVIMTRTHLASHYEKMVTGQEVLESWYAYSLLAFVQILISASTAYITISSSTSTPRLDLEP